MKTSCLKYYVNGERVEFSEFEKAVKEAVKKEQFSKNKEDDIAMRDFALYTIIGTCKNEKYKCTINGQEFESSYK